MTTQRVLIAYDGSHASDFIFDDLPRAGLPETGEATILTVSERRIVREEVIGGPASGGTISNEAGALSVANSAAKRLSTLLPGWEIKANVAKGSPAGVILEFARKWNADLIVAAAVGHTALERILVGSVSHKIANESPCSVRIARGGNTDRNARIVLGYDDMAGSRQAVEAIAGRSWPKGTAIRLHVAVGFGEAPLADSLLPEDAARVRQILKPAENSLAEAGLEVSHHIVEDDPKLSIIAEAETFQANSIFIGHNNHTLRSRLLLGTVASAIVPRATCSVEIVRPKVDS